MASSSPQLQHTCPRCSYNTAVPYSAAVFSQPLACGYCNHLSPHINLTAIPDVPLPWNDDQLAQLLATQLSISQPSPSTPSVPLSAPQQSSVPYRPSQHYYQPIRHIKQQINDQQQQQQPTSSSGARTDEATAQLHPLQYAYQHGRPGPGEPEPYMSAGYTSTSIFDMAGRAQRVDVEMDM